MKIRREDMRIEQDLKSSLNASQLMKWYEGSSRNSILPDPVLNEMLEKITRDWPEMFPLTGVIYTAVTGNIIVTADDGSLTRVRVPHDFMANILMDTWYVETNLRERWHDDRDYSKESEWGFTSDLGRCDKRIIDPSRMYGMYVACMPGYGQPYFGLMLNMYGGNDMMRSTILSDLHQIIRGVYPDEMVAQDAVKAFSDALPTWMRISPPAKGFFEFYPELQKYKRYYEEDK